MAQNNRREIELALSVTTANADALSKLQQDVRSLAKEGGDAAPAFQKLADELAQLAEQAKQLTALEGLTSDLSAASAAQKEAAAQSGALKGSLMELVAATDAARTAEREKNAELGNAKRAVQETQDSIARLKNDTADADKTTHSYIRSLADLKTQLLDARAAKRELSYQLEVLKGKTREAAAAVSEQSKAYKEADAVTRTATTAMQALQTQVGAAAAKYKEAGGAAIELQDAQKKLGEAAATTRAAIQALITEQDRLAQAEREAAAEAQRHADIMAATKARLAAQAKAEADGIISDYARIEQAQREAAQSAKAAGDAIANAFGTVGQRSAQAIRAEIERVREAMRLLSSSGAATGAELAQAMRGGEAAIANLERELRQATGTMTTADRAAGLLKNSLSQITAGNLVADGIGYLVGKVKELGSEFVQAIMQGDKMRLAMNAIYKDAGLAASQIKFLKDSANAAGVSYGDLSKDFIRFSAAMNSANIPMQQSNELFASLTRAAGSLGMSAEETSGALNALGQMASKGVVSMEELRQQLGDRLPGAMGLAAKGFGITEAALIELVSSGNLAARDLFPVLAESLKTMHGETNGLSGALERLKNVFKGFSQDMGDSGWATLLTFAIKGLGIAVSAVLMPLQIMWELIRNIAVSAAALAAAVQGDFAGAMDIMRISLDESNKRLTAANARIAEMVMGQGQAAEATGAATAAIQNNTAAAGANASATSTAAVQMGALAQAAVQSAEGVSGLERVTQLQALAMKLAGDATLDASAKTVQFNLAAAQMLTAQEKATEAAAKEAKAMQDTGDAMVALIALRGDEQATLVASATAAANYQTAIEKANASQQAELQILELQMAARLKEQTSRGLSAEQIKQENAALDAKLVTARAEAEQSKASAEAARQEALARDISAQSYADNSAKVAEYAAALEKASAELAALQAHHERGTITAEQVREGQEKLTRAQALYNDALKDSVTKLQAYGEAQKSVHNLIAAGLNLELKQAEASERTARLLGQESVAREAASKQREIEIKLVENKVQALKAEADAMEQAAIAQEKELLAKGKISEVDQIRIDNSKRTAEAKRLEAQAIEAGIPAMQKEAELLGKSAEAHIKKAEAIKAKTTAMKAESDLIVSGLQLRKSELDASIAIAQAAGNEKEVIRLKIEQKRIEIQIIQETVKAQIAEAEASAAVAKAKMSELASTGQLTAEKRAELQAQIKGAEATINQAKARGQSVRTIEEEIKALQASSSGYDKNASSINQTTAALEKMNAAREKEIAAQEKKIQLDEREQELYRKKWQMDKEGYSVDADGKRIEQVNETQQSIYSKGKDAGLTAKQAQELADRFAPRGKDQFFRNDEFWKEVNRLKQLNDLAEEELKNKPAAPAPSPAPAAPTPSPAPIRAPAPAPAPRQPQPQQPRESGGSASITGPSAPGAVGGLGNTYISNITIPGVGRASPRFADGDSQAQVEGLIRQLVSAQGAAIGGR